MTRKWAMEGLGRSLGGKRLGHNAILMSLTFEAVQS